MQHPLPPGAQPHEQHACLPPQAGSLAAAATCRLWHLAGATSEHARICMHCMHAAAIHRRLSSTQQHTAEQGRAGQGSSHNAQRPPGIWQQGARDGGGMWAWQQGAARHVHTTSWLATIHLCACLAVRVHESPHVSHHNMSAALHVCCHASCHSSPPAVALCALRHSQAWPPHAQHMLNARGQPGHMAPQRSTRSTRLNTPTAQTACRYNMTQQTQHTHAFWQCCLLLDTAPDP